MTIDDNGCDMTCRAPNGSTTCSGTPTGAQLGYNNEGQLTSWQNAPSSPSGTDGYLYDGEGNRVEQQVTTGLPGSPITTTTVYIGNIEEVSTASNSPTSTTTYYYAGQQRIALAVSGSFSYLATDALGSSTLALNPTGTPTGATLAYDNEGRLYDGAGNRVEQQVTVNGSITTTAYIASIQ